MIPFAIKIQPPKCPLERNSAKTASKMSITSNLTIMGVKFSDLKTLESTADALGSNMFEGFKPTPKGIEIIRDYVTGKISLTELVAFAKQKAYA